MTISGKKFSQLTDPQKIATRNPITGWLVNNVLLNVNSYPMTFVSSSETGLIGETNAVFLINDASNYEFTFEQSNQSGLDIGHKSYVVNINVYQTIVTAGLGLTLLPYSVATLTNPYGVFQLEKTGIDEWTITAIENGLVGED